MTGVPATAIGSAKLEPTAVYDPLDSALDTPDFADFIDTTSNVSRVELPDGVWKRRRRALGAPATINADLTQAHFRGFKIQANRSGRLFSLGLAIGDEDWS